MATTLTMPKLGLTMTEGTVVKWLKQHGETVDKDQPLVVVMSKKITLEVQAPASGIVHIVARPQDVRPVSGVIGFILAPGEAPPAAHEGGAPPPAPTAAPPPAPAPPGPAAGMREVRSSPAARRLAKEMGIDLARVPGSGDDGRITETDVQRFAAAQTPATGETPASIQATPLARRMAEEEGLDLARIAGTGPGGRVTEDDILRAMAAAGAGQAPQAGGSALPLSGMRRAIAETMMASLHSMAQLTLNARADVTELAALREPLRERWQVPISYTDLIVKAVALALRQHPLLNSTLAGDEIVLHDEVNVGVAVALDDITPQALPAGAGGPGGAGGLLVPVVCGADRLAVPDIHRAVHRLAERARTGALSVDEVAGATFTVTNLGMYGIESFTPIVNPPEVAILGIGGIGEELALANERVVVRSKMVLSLTIDHRVVDGAPGAAFLQAVVRLLEHPALIVAEDR